MAAEREPKTLESLFPTGTRPDINVEAGRRGLNCDSRGSKVVGEPLGRAVDPPFDRFCSDEYSDNNASEYKDKNASFPWTAFSLRYTAAAWVFLPTGRGRVALGGERRR